MLKQPTSVLFQEQQLMALNKQSQRRNSTNNITTGRLRGVIGSNKLTSGQDYVSLNSALVEVIQYETVQKLLQAGHSWKFNVFHLKRATADSPLTCLGLSLFEKHDLIRHFKLDYVKLLHTFHTIEDAYLDANSFHNALHATDVMQAINCLLMDDKLKEATTPFDVLCSLMAAVCHDVDHPGVNQVFLVETNHYLAKLYKESSVLENHHWRVSISILQKTRLFDHFDFNTWYSMKTRISDMIMATDISRQNDYLQRFQKMIENFKETGAEEESIKHNEKNRKLVLEIALKCADISNPCRSWDISHEWSKLVCEEFFNQGDQQLRLGHKASFNRHTSTIPAIQTFFISNLVKPLFNAWHDFMNTEQSRSMQSSIETNLSTWKKKADAIKRAIEEAQEVAREKEQDKIKEEQKKQQEEDTAQLSICVAAVTAVNAVANLATVAAVSTAVKILSSSQNNLAFPGKPISMPPTRQLSPDYSSPIRKGDYNPYLCYNRMSRRCSLPLTQIPAPQALSATSPLPIDSNNFSGLLSSNPEQYASSRLQQRRISLPANRYTRSPASNIGTSYYDSQVVDENSDQCSNNEGFNVTDISSSMNYSPAAILAATLPRFSPHRRASVPSLGFLGNNASCVSSRKVTRSRYALPGVSCRSKPLTEGTSVNYDGQDCSDIEAALIESTSSDNVTEQAVTSIGNQARPSTLNFFSHVDETFRPRSNSVDISGTYGSLSIFQPHLRLPGTNSMTMKKSNNCGSQMSSLANLHSCHSSTSDIMAVV